MPHQRHVTTRRGFIAAMGFGAVSLYGVWAAYGASPLPFGGREQTAGPQTNGHGGHGAPEPAAEPQGHGGHGSAAGLSPEAFRSEHDLFLQQYIQPDGSVDPHAGGVAQGHDGGGHDGGASDAPIDLYLLTFKWGYDPQELRLRAGVPYRLRMMAEDITHGASLQLGKGSRIIRLRPNVVSEQTLTFRKPGIVLVYCTVYCGSAHDAMQGRIVVA